MTQPGEHVEEPRDLESLRAHMRDMHGFGEAGMLPLKVLLRLHEQDHEAHAHGRWDGSPDSSRTPGFIARKT